MSIIDQLHNDFHAHLDECQQCRDEPFNLCLEGKAIMQKASEAVQGQRCEHGLRLYGAKCMNCEEAKSNG